MSGHQRSLAAQVTDPKARGASGKALALSTKRDPPDHVFIDDQQASVGAEGQ